MIFLFTDIEGSTKLWQEYGAEMPALLARHDVLLAEVIGAYDGRLVKHTGDGVFAVFADGAAAPACALAIQRRFQDEPWGLAGGLRVRVGMHAGAAQERAGDYYGAAVNCAARVTEIGWGGQILVSEQAAAFPPPAGATWEDLGVFMLRDLAAPVRIFQMRSPELARNDFPPPRSVANRPHNLPTPATPFIGRENELAALAALLADPGRRVITLLGPGGAGKTRLGLQAAAAHASRFQWGAYFVPLAGVTDAAYVMPAMGAALRYEFAPGPPPGAQIQRYIGEREFLIVCDNFEHVMAAAADVAALVEGCPNLKVLVTSRQRLALRAETVVDVRGMAAPPEGGAGDNGSGAVGLFLACATRLRPDAVFGEDDRRHIARICRLVDGLPLAVEIAASWTRVLSPAEIAAEVAGDISFLEAGGADVPDRHRSLEAVFNYSYALLMAGEQAALRRCAAMWGEFDLAAARAVSGATVATLSALVDKSLLARVGKGFGLHDQVRRFAAARLAEDAEEERRTRAAHAAYYLDMVEELTPARQGEQAAALIAALTAAIGNIRAAWDWSVEAGDWEKLFRAAEGVTRLAAYGGFYGDAYRMYGRAVEELRRRGQDLPAERKARILVRFLVAYASFLMRSAGAGDPLPTLREAFAAAKRNRDDDGLLRALLEYARLSYLRRRFAAALRAAEAARRLAAKAGDRIRLTMALANLGLLRLARDEFEGGEAYCRQALALARELGRRDLISGILNNLGNLLTSRGVYDEALALCREALAVARGQGYKMSIAFALHYQAQVLVAMGRPAEAVPLLEESLAIRVYLNDPGAITDTYVYLALARAALGEGAGAEEAAAAALAYGERCDPAVRAEAHLAAAAAARAAGKHEAAALHAGRGLRRALEAEAAATACAILNGVAGDEARAGDLERAAAVAAAVARSAPAAATRQQAAALLAAWGKAAPPEGDDWKVWAERYAAAAA